MDISYTSQKEMGTLKTRKELIMKDYKFCYPHEYNEEKFYFENGQKNTIVISAETPEEAMETLLSCVSYEYEDEVLECYAEEIDWESYNAPHYYVYWSVADGHFSESEPQKLSEKRVVHKARR